MSQSTLRKQEIEVELATLVETPPDGDRWLHEIKFDGYRLICRIDRGKARLITRGNQDWTGRFREIAQAAGLLPAKQAVIDGEAVALTADGISDFARLQRAFQKDSAASLIYFAFDLLFLDGRDLRDLPLDERKAILAQLLRDCHSDGATSPHCRRSGKRPVADR
jgi:bifunctional non-homologous end joining protein LigD